MKCLCLAIIVSLLAACAIVYAEETTYIDEKYGFSITYPINYQIIKSYQRAPLVICLPSSSMFFRDHIMVTVTATRPSDRSAEELIDIHFKYDRTVQEKKEVTINNIKFISVVQTQSQRFLFFKINLKLYHLITVKGNAIYTISYVAFLNNYDKSIGEAKKIMHSFKFL